MAPDTYFFVELLVDDEPYNYGPYLDLESATVIMIDIVPVLAQFKAKRPQYSYQCKLKEKIMDAKEEWTTVNVLIIEEKSYRRKTS